MNKNETRAAADDRRCHWARGELTVREHGIGDIGWVTHRHGVIYHQEFGWDAAFEAFVAVVLGTFAQSYERSRERSWIAEHRGRFAGCAFVARECDSVARLRCLLVEPSARGLGIGSHLVKECIDFARNVGYGTLTLWTNNPLHAARRIYKRNGFVLIREEPHHSFGQDLVGQTWNLDLTHRRGT